LKNTFYEFGTLLHCFSDRSISGPYAGAKTHSPSNAVFKAVPNVQQFLYVVNSWLVHAQLDMAVN